MPVSAACCACYRSAVVVLPERDHPGPPLGDLAVAHDEHLGHGHTHLPTRGPPSGAGELRHDHVALLDHSDDLQLGWKVGRVHPAARSTTRLISSARVTERS